MTWLAPVAPRTWFCPAEEAGFPCGTAPRSPIGNKVNMGNIRDAGLGGISAYLIHSIKISK